MELPTLPKMPSAAVLSNCSSDDGNASNDGEERGAPVKTEENEDRIVEGENWEEEREEERENCFMNSVEV